MDSSTLEMVSAGLHCVEEVYKGEEGRGSAPPLGWVQAQAKRVGLAGLVPDLPLLRHPASRTWSLRMSRQICPWLFTLQW